MEFNGSCGKDGTETYLTEQESAVYDRQIRIWGVEAQRRLSKARYLVAGISGVTVEACKNIVLAGVGSLTLMDDRVVKPENAASSFLLTPESWTQDPPETLAQACCTALRDFNPMVEVSSVSGPIAEKDGAFFDSYDVVVLGRAPLSVQKHVNELCRQRPQRVSFYSVDCRGVCGLIFVDLIQHSFASQRKGDEKLPPTHVKFPSLEAALSVPWSSYPRRTAPLLYAFQVVLDFEQREGREPGAISTSDLPSLLQTRDVLSASQGVQPSLISDASLQAFLDAGQSELPPVSAIVGGILGQELIKCVSEKGEPINNFFAFDAVAGKGCIETIGGE
eukprot:TRINITY_DN22402_c0_g1_i1.p1 TRINITY_DN22402_c0_g1~~TRINITY_DN22402_c0_g1_i1.p1  ORF type:complete len:334 (+),score=46.88 TRINITY_DN22402_c0_g1_i1:25-1026(+)